MRSSLGRLVGCGLAFCSSIIACASATSPNSDGPDVAKVTYKEPGICETTPGVKSYSGYVTLPATDRQPYAQKIFFWFFEARNGSPQEAPLTIYTQGGPGAPSIGDALGLNGPCTVLEDSNTTVLNHLSWSNHVNVLYVDQPVQTGFSYDVATPGVLDMITGEITPGKLLGPANYTVLEGVYGSQDPTKAPMTTAAAMEVLWEFTQAWMKTFTQYRRDKISIWAQSYGGHFAPALANIIHTQSTFEKRVANGISRECEEQDDYLDIDVDSVGIINGFIDFKIQGQLFPSFARNNTYGIEAYEQAVADEAYANFTRPGGCKDQIEECRALTPNGYRDQFGADEAVANVCGPTFDFCWNNVYGAYDVLSGRDYFDIAHLTPTNSRLSYMMGFLTRKWVLEALGAETSYTPNGNAPLLNFMATGDFVYDGFAQDIGSLLDDGVKVALLHGDRDFRCHWVGGEAVSLAVDYKDSEEFRRAGYAEISTNNSYVGGMVRQKGKFSFSRVFQAGHSVVEYQPETAYQIFMRTVFGQDIATGTVDLADSPEYETQGPASVFDIKNEPPKQQPEVLCHVLDGPLPLHCTPEQIKALQADSAIVEDFVVVSPPGVRSETK